MEADAADLMQWISDPAHRIIDVRSHERYRGENEPIDPVAGHIPGAVNAFYGNYLTPEGYFRPPGELRRSFQEILDGIPADQTAFYCGSGVTAALGILAMAHAGLNLPRLYAGSWSEWITDPERPVET